MPQRGSQVVVTQSQLALVRLDIHHHGTVDDLTKFVRCEFQTQCLKVWRLFHNVAGYEVVYLVIALDSRNKRCQFGVRCVEAEYRLIVFEMQVPPQRSRTLD